MIGADPLALHVSDPATFGLVPQALLEILSRAGELMASKGAGAGNGAGDEEEGQIEDVTMMVTLVEIYNNRIRDLLNPERDSTALRVREHPTLGPIVEPRDQAQISPARASK